MGNEALALSVDDISGGLKESSKFFSDKGKAYLGEGKEAAKKVDVKNGWAPFVESIKTDESKNMVVKIPSGAAFMICAVVLYAIFGVFFCATKYGPSTYDKVKEKVSQVNETAIVPLKAKLRPLISDAKAKIEQAINERKAAYQASAAASPAAEAEGDSLT